MSHPLRSGAEEGASATLFLLSLFVFLGIAMLAIDVGFVMTSRRGQVADTDSAALAAAQRMLDRPPVANCPTTSAAQNAAARDAAIEYAGKNDPNTTVLDPVQLTVTAAAGGCPLSGEVEVSTQRSSVLIFAPLFGYDDAPTSAATTAIFGEVEALKGLRPMGICVEDPHFVHEFEPYLTSKRAGNVWGSSEWATAKGAAETQYQVDRPGLFVATDTKPPLVTQDYQVHPIRDKDGNLYPSDAVVHRFKFTVEGRNGLDYCGDGPSGNFGWLDFDGNGKGDVAEDCDGVPAPPSELNCDIGNGFQGEISIKPPDCAPNSSSTACPPENGEVSSADRGLGKVECPSASSPAADCEKLYVVVYDKFDPKSPEFDLVTVIGVVLRDFDTKIDNKNPNSNYLDLELVDDIVSGVIGPADPTSIGPLGITLCATDGADKCPD